MVFTVFYESGGYFIEVARVFMMMVITGFMYNVQRYEHATGEADSQSQDVDKRKKFIASDIAPGNFKVISQHGRSIRI
jgi:hypothetical protein